MLLPHLNYLGDSVMCFDAGNDIHFYVDCSAVIFEFSICLHWSSVNCFPGVTFKNFGLPRRNCPASFPTATSTGNEDEQHLIITSDIIMDEVDMNYESYYNRPNDGYVQWQA